MRPHPDNHAHTRLEIALVVASVCLFTSGAGAQGTTAVGSQNITPDPRVQGIGRAGTALIDGPFLAWWNPAALAFAERWGAVPHSKAHLVPGLAPDVWGNHYGISGRWSRAGLSLLHSRVAYGEHEQTDAQGQDLGTYEPFDWTTRLGVGVPVAERRWSEGSVLRAAVGGNFKLFHAYVAPVSLRGGKAQGTTWDVDLSGLVEQKFEIPLSIDVGGEERRSAVALRAGLTWKNALGRDLVIEGIHDPLGSSLTGGLAIDVTLLPLPYVGPALRLLLAADEFKSLTYDDEHAIGYRGVEVTLLNVLSIRRGFVDDPDGDITDTTEGIGVGIGVEGYGGVRYDWAEVPQASGLCRVTHRSYSLWIDGMALLQRNR